MTVTRRPKTFVHRLHRAIEAQVPQKNLRDLRNRLRFGERAPLSDMAIYPRPAGIDAAYAPGQGAPRFRRRQSGMVVAGDWDLHTTDVTGQTKWISCYMHWIDGADWPETPIYRRMLEMIGLGKAPDECRSKQDLDDRYRALDRIFRETRARGRLLNMSELPGYFRREHGGTFVHVARDGRCLRAGGGAHRFAIARILDLPEMPAQLGVIHPDAIRDGHLDRLRDSVFGDTARRSAA